MPCYTVKRMSIDLNAANFELLKKAAVGLGAVNAMLDEKNKTLRFTVDGSYVYVADGKITVNAGQEGVVDRLKVAYTREVLKSASARFKNIGLEQKSETKGVLKWRF